MNIKVLVVDDQALVRAGFRVLVENAHDMEVVGEAADGLEAIELARDTNPDVVMMDIRMPRVDGIEATRLITTGPGGEHVRVLILTTFDLDEYVYGALRAGASGFLLKDTPPEQLLSAIRIVAAGEALLAPSVTRRMIEEIATRSYHEATADLKMFDVLTAREHEVLLLVAQGCSNQEIADSLFMSPATAKTHVSRLLTKLDARDRVQLVVMAYESGLVGDRR
ncbi:MAG: response regulator transcription factor [Acidimicrobiales bacterium]|jgi:DNA-binding NarL/FixJ family response regulator